MDLKFSGEKRMRRGRAQPLQWIPGDSGDSLYRSSSLRRRRDASPEFQDQLKLQLFLHLLHQELEIHLHRYWLDRVR